MPHIVGHCLHTCIRRKIARSSADVKARIEEVVKNLNDDMQVAAGAQVEYTSVKKAFKVPSDS
jgi:hypothetical protein